MGFRSPFQRAFSWLTVRNHDHREVQNVLLLQAEILQCIQLVIKQESLILFLGVWSGIPPRPFWWCFVLTSTYSFLTFHTPKVLLSQVCRGQLILKFDLLGVFFLRCRYYLYFHCTSKKTKHQMTKPHTKKWVSAEKELDWKTPRARCGRIFRILWLVANTLEHEQSICELEDEQQQQQKLDQGLTDSEWSSRAGNNSTSGNYKRTEAYKHTMEHLLFFFL